MPSGFIVPVLWAARVFLVLWTAMALANVIGPRWIWRITESWRGVREPSSTYFVIRRVVGVAMLLAAIAVMGIGVLAG